MSTVSMTLSTDKIKALADDLRAIERREKKNLGAKDMAYIRSIHRTVLILEALGRALLFISFIPAAWALGVIFLSLSKIIENTELGHNIMHGQYDWAQDMRFLGKTYEFDAVATSDHWRSGHNIHHHLNTGIHGLDNDVGFLRTSSAHPWRWYHIFQLPLAITSAFLAQWGVAIQNMRLNDLFQERVTPGTFWKERVMPFFKKSSGRLLKDYLIFPLLAGPYFLSVLTGNLIANAIRNIWVWLIIACGHCVGLIRLYQPHELQDQPKEHWYVRQITSSANFSAGPILSVMTGHLGYHIEHHLFPDLPAWRYRKIAPEIQNLCSHYGLYYNNRSLPNRITEVFWSLIKYSVPRNFCMNKHTS